MAISAPHYRCLRELHRRGELPQGGSILEIGEANWYGDLSTDAVGRDINSAIGNTKAAQKAADMFLQRLVTSPTEWIAYDLVKVVYQLLFDAIRVDSIDFSGTPNAEKRDLNTQEVEKGNNYETVINHGTAEHIFNIANVFRLMHDQCKPGGLMIHESPFTGWVDHGFWNINPTAYYDLAAANGYKMVYVSVNQIEGNVAIPIESREQLLQMAKANAIPNNSMLWVCMRKETDAKFKIPMQGVYNGTLSEEAAQAWKELR